MTTSQKERIREFFNSIRIDYLDINDFIRESDYEDIDLNNSFESIRDTLEESGAFEVEILYYGSAIEYLAKNDPSLKNSLEIAKEFGFELDNLNSERLASLLASENTREEFDGLKSEIEGFFSELLEEIENEE